MLALALAALALTPGPKATDVTPWDPILRDAGIDASAIQISPTVWREGGLYATKTFNAFWADWRKLEPTTLAMARDLVARAERPDQVCEIGAARLDAELPGVSRGRSARLRLRDAILACGGTAPADRTKLEKALRGVPRDVAGLAASALQPLPHVAELRLAAFAALKEPEIGRLAAESLNFATSFDLGPRSLDLIEKTDVRALAGAAREMSAAAIALRTRKPSRKPFRFEWPTALGRIELSGGGNDTHNLDGALIVIDTGGDDAYAGAPIEHPGVTVVIDFGGNDRYRNCGLGVLGVSGIFDFAGDDTYLCEGSGNGGAAFGAAVLFDAAGRDRYASRDLGAGAAVCGIGLLLDLAGDDEYLCRACSEGFGGPRGFGALVDLAGSDRYSADDEHIDNPSAQTAQHNVSMSQGAGFGRRAHPGDGHSMAGGIGILVDAAGNDTYRCGVFGQGVAYWYSIGALVDLAGADSYTGQWYVQGSAAHYAISCLLDLEGNDHYVAHLAQSLGQGHDYSIGLLHDFAGDDFYEAKGGAMVGSGRWNGLGLFADDAGANRYALSGACLGDLGEYRPGEPCFALFADHGTPTFTGPAGAAPGKVWYRQRQAKAPIVLGAGWTQR